jgi:hypothetical protein
MLPPDNQATALRKLHLINAATRLADLKIPPANRLERLKAIDRADGADGLVFWTVSADLVLCWIRSGREPHRTIPVGISGMFVRRFAQ